MQGQCCPTEQFWTWSLRISIIIIIIIMREAETMEALRTITWCLGCDA